MRVIYVVFAVLLTAMKNGKKLFSMENNNFMNSALEFLSDRFVC